MDFNIGFSRHSAILHSKNLHIFPRYNTKIS